MTKQTSTPSTQTDPSDNALMVQVAEGEINALQPLFRRYHKVLNGFFKNHGCCDSISQDLTQETFLRILRFRESFKPKYSFKAWMFRIARNVRIDHFRKNKEGASAFNDQLQQISTEVEYTAPTGTQSEDLEHLQLAINKLQPDQREILFLARFEQLKYEEISKITGYSVSNVKIRVFRALQKLKEHFYQFSEA